MWLKLNIIAHQLHQNTSQVAQITSPPSALLSSATPTGRHCALACTHENLHFIANVWQKYYVENVTVATIIKVVDDSTNKTSMITQYVESLLVNGTALSNTARTDTNEAGTVTQVVTGFNNSTTIV